MPDRILIIRLSHLGDVVHALGVFHALHAAYPRAEIGWVTQPEFADLLRGIPGLSRVFLFGRRDGWRAWPRIRRELREFGADLAVDAQGNWKSAGVLWCSRAPRRVGLARADWREPLGSWVVNNAAPPLAPEAVHAMDRMLALARHVSPSAVSPLRLDAALTGSERAAGERRLAERFPGAGEGAVLLHLSSPGDIRSWPLDRWRELVRHLGERNRPTLLLSGPAEEGAGRRLAEEFADDTRLHHWVGQRGLRELAAILEAAGARGMRMVGSDSGPMHLGVAAGLSVVALAGPQDAARTGPWGGAPARHHVVRAASPPECAPCLARQCDHPDGPVCMAHITAEDVLRVL